MDDSLATGLGQTILVLFLIGLALTMWYSYVVPFAAGEKEKENKKLKEKVWELENKLSLSEKEKEEINRWHTNKDFREVLKDLENYRKNRNK